MRNQHNHDVARWVLVKRFASTFTQLLACFPHNGLRCYSKYFGANDFGLGTILKVKQFDTWKLRKNCGAKHKPKDTGERLTKQPAKRAKTLLQTTLMWLKHYS